LVGPKNVVQVARDIGITSPLKPILSLPLGANEVSMMEMTAAYMVFANMGVKVTPTAILRIEDRNGIPLFEHQVRERKVFDANLIAALVEMMEGNVDYGTGRGAKLPRPMAGKTGTTSSFKDAWFIGYTPQLVTSAWVGNDDNQPMNNVTGGWIPARMWRDYMKEALRDVKAQSFTKPRGMVTRKVNWETGLLASKYTPEEANVSFLKYWAGKEPKKYDSEEANEAIHTKRKQEVKEQNEILDFFEVN
jgi:penicillin-binding protein 1A